MSNRSRALLEIRFRDEVPVLPSSALRGATGMYALVHEDSVARATPWHLTTTQFARTTDLWECPHE